VLGVGYRVQGVGAGRRFTSRRSAAHSVRKRFSVLCARISACIHSLVWFMHTCTHTRVCMPSVFVVVIALHTHAERLLTMAVRGAQQERMSIDLLEATSERDRMCLQLEQVSSYCS